MFVSKLKATFSVGLILGVMATGATFLPCRTAVGEDAKQPDIQRTRTVTSPKNMAKKQVTVTFLAGAKRVPLDGLKVTIRKDTGDWTRDHKANPLTDGKTGKQGTARFTLSDGSYYVAIDSEKELPYVGIAAGYSRYEQFITVGKDKAFDFNLVDASLSGP